MSVVDPVDGAESVLGMDVRRSLTDAPPAKLPGRERGIMPDERHADKELTGADYAAMADSYEKEPPRRDEIVGEPVIQPSAQTRCGSALHGDDVGC